MTTTTTTSVDPLLVAAGLKGTEGGTNSIVFSTNASGPSFGTVQLDAGLPSRPGYSVLNQIMVSAGFDADTVAAVDTASQQITQIKTYTQASAFGDTSGVNSQSLVVALTKQVEFIKIIGELLNPDGSAAEQQAAGANVFENLNGAVQNSSQYINSVSSNQVDGITTQVSNIISNISNGGGNLGILGLPSSDQNYAAAVIAISDVINNYPAAVPGFLASLNAAAANGPITLATIYGAAPASLATTGWENNVWATAGSYSSGSSQYSSWYLPADSRVSSPTFLTPINYNPDASDDAADYYDQLAESDNTGDVLQSDTALVFDNGGVYSVLGLGALPQVLTLSGLATPPTFDAAGNLDATFAVGSGTTTVALNPTTGAVVNDPTAVTATFSGQTVTLLGLGGSSPFALISNDNSVTAGAVSSNGGGSYTDQNGDSFFVAGGVVTTQVTPDGNGGWIVSSFSGVSENSWTVSGANGPVSIGDDGSVHIPTSDGYLSLNPVTKVLSALDSNGNPLASGSGSQIQISGSGTSDSLQIDGPGNANLANFDPSVSSLDIQTNADGSQSIVDKNGNVLSAVTLNLPDADIAAIVASTYTNGGVSSTQTTDYTASGAQTSSTTLSIGGAIYGSATSGLLGASASVESGAALANTVAAAA